MPCPPHMGTALLSVGAPVLVPCWPPPVTGRVIAGHRWVGNRVPYLRDLSGSKKPPKPLQFDTADPGHMEFVLWATVLFASVYQLPVPDLAQVRDAAIPILQVCCTRHPSAQPPAPPDPPGRLWPVARLSDRSLGGRVHMIPGNEKAFRNCTRPLLSLIVFAQ